MADDQSTQQTPPADAQPATPAPQPAEVLSPKERRQRARAARAARTATRRPMTAQERQEQRSAQRARKAALRRVERRRAREKARAASGPAVATAPREHQPAVQKTRQGVVVSDRADKTITVRIDIARRHRRYEKIVRTSRALHAHDEHNDAHVGDTVVVRECRPLSRSKRWRLVSVLERAQ